MKRVTFTVLVAAGLLTAAAVLGNVPEAPQTPLGLPPLPIPEDNPQTPAKIALGEQLFHDMRFSTSGDVSCATCHDAAKAFTDSPLRTSEGIEKKTGTRNAPTVVNAAYFETQFWDGRSPSLEDQALHPFVNPVEMGLTDHEPILEVIRSDADYVKAFEEVFGVAAGDITIDEVTKAIAAFERTQIAGDSPFDRWRFGGEKGALTEQQVRGFDIFINQGRCVSCHVIEQTQALFTDNRFHNIGVGINRIQDEVPELALEFLEADMNLAEVDIEVLTDPKTSEIGRFAISHGFDDLGSFKTPTLRNVAVTAPYMHDGSVADLRAAVVHYNNGGVTNEGDPVNDFLSSGIRPLNLSDEQIDDLVAFMEALTSPQFAQPADTMAAAESRRQQ
ncbi:MAG TPA: cytochrome c peroxidase [Chondromyces sp.]|nr:cytochrome c peroxidase [Chondromyces sp.]